MNGLSVCLDEIALEGLDGITLSTLWKRLDNAAPRLLSTLDNSYKVFLWNSIRSQNVQTFLLKEPREKLESFAEDAKVYPFVLIDSQKSGGIRGSCSTFHSRELVDVSKDSLEMVEESYGDRLVLVASQVMRERVLFHTEVDTSVEITDMCYCLLEWIGRARNLGRIQSCCSSFTGMDPKTVFHYMKVLQRQQVVTKQTVYTRRNKTCIWYLPMYHDEHVNDSLACSICNIIENKPRKTVLVQDLCLCLRVPVPSIMQSLLLLSERGHIKTHQGVGSAGSNLFLAGRSKETNSTTLTYDLSTSVTLVKPFYNRCFGENDDIYVDNDGDDDLGDVDEDEEIYATGSNCDFVLNIPAEVPLINHVYQLIVSKGFTGITSSKCHGILGLPWHDVRAVLKQLEASQEVTVIFEDIGRQRLQRYIATNIFKEHQKQLKEAAVSTENQPDVIFQNEHVVETGSVSNDTNESMRKSAPSPIDIQETTKNEHHKSFGFTEKFQKRRKFITDFLDKHKVIRGEFVLRKEVIKKEAESGEVGLMDRRTFCKFLRKLKDSGTIQIFDITIDVEGKNDTLVLICDITVEKDNPEVLAQVNMHKNKLLIENRVKEAMQKNMTQKELIMKNAKLGFLPKMPRAEMLHIFLYIVVYEMFKPDNNMHTLRRKFDWVEHLTSPPDNSAGWFTAKSILGLLPLSLYVRLINLSYKVPLLEEYLNDPTTRHMPIKDLPEPLNCYLIDGSRNIPSLLETLGLLAKMNLVTPTTKSPFIYARDIACHLNKRAALLDTRTSLPGYCEVKHPAGGQFPEVIHHFSSLTNVIEYWSSLRDICWSTNLGFKGKAKDCTKEKSTTNIKNFIKDEVELYASIKPLGDGLGAAGLDSGFFSHLKRNWSWTCIGNKKHPPVLVEDTMSEGWQECFTTTTVPADAVPRYTGGKGVKRKRIQPAKKEKASKKVKLGQKDAKKSKPLQQDTSVGSAPIVSRVKTAKASKEAKVRKKIRMRAKEVVKRAHWNKKIHDQRDLEAQKRKGQRISFTPQEQKLLFICTLALRILGKKSTETGYTDWLWTRDVLYKDDFESAKVKTAENVSRKYRTIMKDPQTKVNLDICTTDCKQEKEFQPFCNLGKNCDEATFNDLVELLKKKYSMENMKTTPLCLPHNLKAFQRQNNLQANLQPCKPVKADEDIVSLTPPVATLSDVRQGVLRDSIVSALLMKDEKYDPSVAYVFLDQFAEEELSLAITELKKNKMLTRALLRYGHGRSLALTTFSQSLSTAGQRILDAHLSPSIVKEAVCFYHQLQQNGFHSHILFPGESAEDLNGGCVAGLFSLLSVGKVSIEMQLPENILDIETEKQNVQDTSIGASSSQPELEKTLSQKENGPALVKGAMSHTNLANKTSSFPDVSLTESDQHEQLTPQDISGMPKQAQETQFIPEQTCAATDVLHAVSNDSIQKETPNITDSANLQMPSNNINTTNIVGDKSIHHERVIVLNEKHVPKTMVARSAVAKTFHFERNVNRSYMDVLYGIEDHIFGNFGQLKNMQNYEVKLKSKSSFSCCFITPHVNSDNQTGECGLQIKKFIGPVANVASDTYHEKILPARIAGSLIRPVIIINPCTVKVSLLSSSEKDADQPKAKESMELVAEYFNVNAHRLPKKLAECLDVCSKAFHFAEKDCQALATVYKSIESGKEIGVTKSKLERMIRHCDDLSNFSLTGLIEVLKSFSLVLEVGFIEVCFVTHSFMQHWALPCPCISQVPSTANQNGNKQDVLSQTTQDSSSHTDDIDGNQCADSVQSEPVVGQSKAEETCASVATQAQQSSPISRPWFCMDGQINKTAYNTFHESVLRYVMRYPGIEKFAIAKHFLNVIFPVALNCILETLEDNHCILRRCSIRKSCTTLFSSGRASTENKVTYYLPTADAIIKLADCVFL